MYSSWKKIMCHDPWTLHWRTLQHGLLELFKDQLKSKLDSLSEGVREVCDLYVCKELCERGKKPCNKISDYTLSLRLLFYFQPDKNALVVANLVFINWIFRLITSFILNYVSHNIYLRLLIMNNHINHRMATKPMSCWIYDRNCTSIRPSHQG